MLEPMVNDRTHALGDRLILQVDAVYAAVDCVAALGGTIDSPVVARVRCEPPTAEPFRRIGKERVAAPRPADRCAILENRLWQRDRRDAALPPQITEHRVTVVERDPGARVDVTAKLTIGRLGPEGKQEVREARIRETGGCRPVGTVLRAPGRVDDV